MKKYLNTHTLLIIACMCIGNFQVVQAAQSNPDYKNYHVVSRGERMACLIQGYLKQFYQGGLPPKSIITIIFDFYFITTYAKQQKIDQWLASTLNDGIEAANEKYKKFMIVILMPRTQMVTDFSILLA